jgi:putative molybdopterin biosynthesis protein
MVAKNARTRIRGMADLTKAGVRFVNRERGSGTRLLVDALLAHAGISATQVGGYEHEEFTHMATAATVRAGAADAAFGIEAAARAHGLAFVPLVTEHYYLACRRRSPARIALDTILASAGSPAFIRALARMGGYESTRTGSAVDLSELFTRPDET